MFAKLRWRFFVWRRRHDYVQLAFDGPLVEFCAKCGQSRSHDFHK